MSEIADEFIAWVLDGELTLEQRYGVFLLLERVRPYDAANFLAREREREERLYNPAWEPVIDPAVLRLVAAQLSDLRSLSLDEFLFEDRPLRNLDFLRFLPALTELTLKDVELKRLEGISRLQHLETFSIRTDKVDDYNDLALCPNLREISIQTWHPWPVIDQWEHAPSLTKLKWFSNGRSLEGVQRLPHLRWLSIDAASHHDERAVSIRDFHTLPEMPQLEFFTGGSFYRLDGVERYTKLRLLVASGYFRDLAPLAGHPSITHLRLDTPELRDLTPVVGIPSLYQFVLHSERPQDFSPLMESESLRELVVFGCPTPQPDVDLVRLMMPDRAETFALAEPRELQPMQLIACNQLGMRRKEDASAEPGSAPVWKDDIVMQQSEEIWMKEQLKAALAAAGLLELEGLRFDGFRDNPAHCLFSRFDWNPLRRSVNIRFLRAAAIARVREVIDALRPVLARSAVPWEVQVDMRPETDAEEWDEPRLDPAEERAREEIEQEKRHDRLRRLESQRRASELRMDLLKEQGATIDPDDFSPDFDEEDEDDFDDEDDEFEDDEDDDAPLNFEPPKPWTGEEPDHQTIAPVPAEPAPPEPWRDPNVNWNDMFVFFRFRENVIWVHPMQDGAKTLSYLLDLEVTEEMDDD